MRYASWFQRGGIAKLFRRRPKYGLKGPLTFPDTPQLDPLVVRALTAANAGKHYREVVGAEEDGRAIKLYVAVNYVRSVPSTLEVGYDLPTAPNVLSGAAVLPPEYGRIEAETGQPIDSVPIILLD